MTRYELFILGTELIRKRELLIYKLKIQQEKIFELIQRVK